MRSYYYFLAHWYFIPRGIEIKKMDEMSGMVIIITILQHFAPYHRLWITENALGEKLFHAVAPVKVGTIR